MRTVVRRRSRLTLPMVGVLLAACASGGGGGSEATDQAPLRPNQGFDGGSQVFGGFTGVASSVLDSVIPQPRARVWDVLPSVFAELEIETPSVSPGTYQMGNPGSRLSRIEGSPRLSRYFDCGIGILGPNADTYEVTLQLLLELSSHASGGTLVRTTVDAFARPRSSSGDPIHCASQRTLEGRILALIQQRLRGSSGGEGAPVELPPMSPGRIPVAGDFLRVQCRPPDGPAPVVGQGTLIGSRDGYLQLLLDARGSTAGVPATQVVHVEIRERRSAARISGFIGMALGATAGALYGASYEEDNPRYPTFHYPKEVFIGVGGVVGGFGGLLLGRVVGSLFTSDTWYQAPPEWAIRSAGAASAPTAATNPCPTF
jgi:hypothetical protein